MLRESLYELCRKIREAKSGGPDAAAKELEELEALFRTAQEEGHVVEFLDGGARLVIEMVACERRALTAALPRWLPDDELSVMANALCNHVGVHYLQVEVAVLFDLKGIDREQAKAVAYRLVARNVPPAVSLGWLLSFAAEHGEDEASMSAVEELMGYHVDELPLSTERLLSNEKSSLVSMEVAQRALTHLRAYNEHLKTLPEARELFMPVPMRLMYASMRRRRNRAINSGTEKRSFFAGLFKSQHFKYSNRAAFEIQVGDRSQEQTVAMAPVSVSMELPISELTDPIAASMQRLEFKRRGKK